MGQATTAACATGAGTTDVLAKVEEIAALAGYKVLRHPGGGLQLGFDMGGGRSQVVFVVPVGRTGDGKEVVHFFSPCGTVKKGFLKGGARSIAEDLLRRNATLLWGAFALTKAGDQEGIIVYAPAIVDTMEVEEFRAHVNYLAIVADQYEKEQGKDTF